MKNFLIGILLLVIILFFSSYMNMRLELKSAEYQISKDNNYSVSCIETIKQKDNQLIININGNKMYVEDKLTQEQISFLSSLKG